MIALTTSSAGDDVDFSYGVGVNSYITKPTTFRDLVEILDALGKYWFEVVELPPKASWRKNGLESCWSKTIPTTSG